MTFLSLLVSPAFACGGFAPVEGALATSDAQQALFDLGSDSITVTYRASYAGNATDFAWVVAVPGQITSVEEGDAEQLDTITTHSAPQVELDPKSDAPTCGCGASSYGMRGGDANLSDTGGVEVTGSGLAGDYAYTTLAASDADSLIAWLTDHGYDVSLIQGAAEAYVADPLDYEFVAVQLRPDAPGEEGRLQPLAITYGAAADGALHALFPAKLGATSTVLEVRTEMFILGEGTATLSGWDAPANPDETDGHTWDIVGADYYDPSGMYHTFLSRLGGTERTMWLTYAGEFPTSEGTRWLTRYDAIVAPATNTVDPVFTDSGEQTEASTILFLMNETQYEDEFPGDTAAVLLVGLLGGLTWRRRLTEDRRRESPEAAPGSRCTE